MNVIYQMTVRTVSANGKRSDENNKPRRGLSLVLAIQRVPLETEVVIRNVPELPYCWSLATVHAQIPNVQEKRKENQKNMKSTENGMEKERRKVKKKGGGCYAGVHMLRGRIERGQSSEQVSSRALPSE